MFRLSFIMLIMLTSGCVSLDPTYQRPALPVSASLPNGYGAISKEAMQWQNVVQDARLQMLIKAALNSNRDVQKAIADIDAARAQVSVSRSALFPSLDAELSHSRSRTLTGGVSGSDQAGAAVSSFELDLFGRNQSLTRAARETWLASEYTAQNTRLTMVSELTTAWITLAADNSQLALARSTMDSARTSLDIAQRRQLAGIASVTDVSEAMAVYQQARASAANYQTQVMQDKNALDLLAGEPVSQSLLPGTLEDLADNVIKLVPAGVSSESLLRRPDILEAEHNLRSANASIGAARANFFPTIALTASAGVGSSSLGSLFSHGVGIGSFAPTLSLPLFSGGSNMAQLRYAEAEKKGLIATYEKTIQSAFKDIADALARRATFQEQLAAQGEYVAAEQATLDVATKSYQAGSGDYLTVLTAQRALWSARSGLISLQQTGLANRITLWQSLGSGM